MKKKHKHQLALGIGAVVVGGGILALIFWPKSAAGALPAKPFEMSNTKVTMKVGQTLPITIPPSTDPNTTRSYDGVSDLPNVATVHVPASSPAIITAVAPGDATISMRLYENVGNTQKSTFAMVLHVTVVAA